MTEPTLPGVQLPADYYIALLTVSFTRQGDECEAVVPVRPELFAPGTHRLRLGHLATMVDLVGGHTPHGPFGPTVDLRIESFAPTPRDGAIHLRSRALRVGKRLIVGETVLSSGGAPFARSLHTFMNLHMGVGVGIGERPILPMAEESFDSYLGARVRDEHSLELDPNERIGNPVQRTVQGGAQAALAELAAEHALGGGRRHVATNLDIRYLGRLSDGPLVATAVGVPATDGVRAAVTLTDGGDATKIVSFVQLTLTPV